MDTRAPACSAARPERSSESTRALFIRLPDRLLAVDECWTQALRLQRNEQSGQAVPGFCLFVSWTGFWFQSDSAFRPFGFSDTYSAGEVPGPHLFAVPVFPDSGLNKYRSAQGPNLLAPQTNSSPQRDSVFRLFDFSDECSDRDVPGARRVGLHDPGLRPAPECTESLSAVRPLDDPVGTEECWIQPLRLQLPAIRRSCSRVISVRLPDGLLAAKKCSIRTLRPIAFNASLEIFQGLACSPLRQTLR